MNRRTLMTLVVIAAGYLLFLNVPAHAAGPEEIDFPVKGMDCGGCAAAVNIVLARLEGVEDFKANYDSERAWMRYDSAKLTLAAIVAAINEKTPFEASLPRDPSGAAVPAQ